MVVQWIIIGLFILICLWYIKLEHHTRKVKVTLIIILGAIIYFSMVGIFNSEKVDLTSPRGIVNAVYIYFGWIGQTASSLWDIGSDTVTMVGNAVRLNNESDESNSPMNRLAMLRNKIDK